MRNCIDIAKIFLSKKAAVAEQDKKMSCDPTENSFDAYGNYNGVNVIDYSNDIVVQKLRRMLP